MKLLTLSVLFALFALFSCVRSESDVITLSEANFHEQTSQGSWLIEFFAPWCGHCKNLAPIWEQLATEVKGEYKVGAVDCTQNKAICSKFYVRGYPTVKFVTEGKSFDYAGARTVEAFVTFAKEGYKSVEGQNVPDLSKLPTTKTEEAKPATTTQVPSESLVVALTEGDFYSKIKEGTWLVKFYAPWCGHCKNLVPTWDSLSTKTQGAFSVAKVDCTVHKSICNDFGVRGYPTLKLIKDGKSYAYSGARSEEALLAFVNNGYTSSPAIDLPAAATEAKEEKDDSPASTKEVVVLTQDNFEEKIASGEWLVEFYAPWCGHCKHLVPIWEELAKTAEANVAKVDCTVEKDLMTQFGIKGFPTIKFIKDGKVYDYKGARSVEAFIAFSKGGYKEATSNPLTLTKNKDEL